MAFDLLNMFSNYQPIPDTSSYSIDKTAVSLAETQKMLQAAIRSLLPGQSLQGEIVEINGREVNLLFQNALMLSAHLEGDMVLNKGQMMTFEVKSNQEGKLSLRPLFANTGMESNAYKALDAASIPITDKSVSMVTELMQLGMPVNKQTLNQIFRQSNQYPDVDIKDIVLLHKMNIPVTKESISQMHLYQTNNQELFARLSDISDGFTELLTQIAENDGSKQLDSFVGKFLEIFQSNSKLQEPQTQSFREIPTESSQNQVPIQEGKTENQTIIKAETENPLQKAETTQETITLETKLVKLLKEGDSKSTEGRVQLKETLFSMMKQEMLMTPDKVGEPEYIKEYYGKILEQTTKLENLLKEIGKENSTLGKNVTQIKGNIEFMNQINELYHYVQLPLKMNDTQASGDLYVYKRKHAKAGEDGNLTALLHLSMKTLGNMDIFLSLHGEKLSTKFCLEKEEMIDFIEEHMDLLNERLLKKGYQVNLQVSGMQKEEESVIEKILNEDKSVPILSKQSFDARA